MITIKLVIKINAATIDKLTLPNILLDKLNINKADNEVNKDVVIRIACAIGSHEPIAGIVK